MTSLEGLSGNAASERDRGVTGTSLQCIGWTEIKGQLRTAAELLTDGWFHEAYLA